MIPENSLVERTVIGFDIKGFSQWSTRRQADAQLVMADMLQSATRAAGLDFAEVLVEGTGDGAFLVLPPDTDLVAVVTELVSKLEIRLRTYNEDRISQAHLRMRVALHTDAILRSGGRFAGPALSYLERLLNSAPVRAVLDDTPAHLAFVVSESIYEKVCRSGLGGIRAEEYVQVAVDIPEKKFSQPAYLHVPGGEPGSGSGNEGLASGPAGGPASGGPADKADKADKADQAAPARSDGTVTVNGDDATVYHHVKIRTDTFTGRDTKR